MSAKFTYNDIVKIKLIANPILRPGVKAWIVGVFDTEKMKGSYFDQFKPGFVYSIEYEDGSSTEVHEDDLEQWHEN